MDLTEIMEFINDLNEGSENANESEIDSQCNNVSPLNDLSPQQRCRANTWHGDRPSKYERTTPPNNDTILEDCAENDDEAFGKSSNIEQSPSSIVSRKSISRRNAWGNLSYADIITKAINSTPDKRMTLSEIYNWMVQNIPFFKDKGDTNSSAGWKNSIRHNLSLHSCFMRVQNEGTGKSSWWMLNPDYKATKLPRRRAATMDTSKVLALHSHRKMKFNKKLESLRMAVGESGVKNDGESMLKSFSSSSDLNFLDSNVKSQVSSTEDFFHVQDFRPRSNSNACHNVKLVTTFESDDNDEYDIPPAPAPSMSSSYTDQPFQWNVSEVFEGNYMLDDKQTGEEMIMNLFNQAQDHGMESTPSGLPISSINMTSARVLGAHPSSLPVPSNLKNLFSSRSIGGFNGDGINSLKNNNFIIHSNDNAKTNESFLLSGGELVRSSSGTLHVQDNTNIKTSQDKNNVDNNNNVNNKRNNNPLLREYLSQDDFSSSNHSSNVYQQKLFTGGTHNQPLTSKNVNSDVASVKLIPWQQQEQQQFQANHGLLLQLLTEKSQQNIQQQQQQQQYYLENLENKVILLSHPNNNGQNQCSAQQHYNSNITPNQLHPNQLSPHHPSMLRHLLTAGQRGHKSSNLSSHHHHHHHHHPMHHMHAFTQSFNQNPISIMQQQSNVIPTSNLRQNAFISPQMNMLQIHPMEHFMQQQHMSNQSNPIVISPSNLSNKQQNQQPINNDRQFRSTTSLTMPATNEAFPSDLDFSLLDLDSSVDIECNIDQVIDHEKKFGDALDFNFDEDFMMVDGTTQEFIK